jgi:hypothetical protein
MHEYGLSFGRSHFSPRATGARAVARKEAIKKRVKLTLLDWNADRRHPDYPNANPARPPAVDTLLQ